MVKSPLRYPGGKSRAIQHLKQFIPEFAECRDVFFGGGSLSLYLCQKFSDKKFLASDLNFELYCFWQQLKTNSEEVIAGVQEIYDHYKMDRENPNHAGKELFEMMVNRRQSDLSDLQRAIDFYVLNRITFSGVVDSGGYSQGSFDARFTQTSIERLRYSVPVIERIEFHCQDYRFLLDKPGKDVFIFLDPPYYSATKSKLYGKNGILHTRFDHEQLQDALAQTKHNWLITYDDSDYIRALYKNYYQRPWKLQYGMTNSNNAVSRAGSELLISNYELSNISAIEKEDSKSQ